jgi:hypothetical protein
MKAFTDAEKRTWELTVNVNTIKRVRDLLGVDLLDVANGDLFSRLSDDACLLVDVIFVLVKPAADALKVSDEDFGRALVGDVLGAASAALVQDLLDFFPRAQRGRALGRLARALEARAAEAKGTAEVLARMAADPGAPGPTSGASSTSAPAPAAATPAP